MKTKNLFRRVMSVLTYILAVLCWSVTASAVEHLTITTTDGGQVKDKILDSDFEDMTYLSIQGPINGEDMKYLTSNTGIMAGVRTLDLKKAKPILDGSTYRTYSYRPIDNVLSEKTRICKFWPRDSISSYWVLNDYEEVYGNNFSGAFYQTDFEKVILPEGTDAIGEHAFYFCSKLKEVVCGGSERYIGSRAFEAFKYNSSQTSESMLESINLPASLDSIADRAFLNAVNLKNIDLSHVSRLGLRSFENSGIEVVELAQGIETIPKDCFRDCNSLKSLTLPSSVKEISESAFYSRGNELSDIVLPEGIEIIEYGAFANSNISSVILPKTLKKVGDYAFAHCKRLESVTIPDDLFNISAGTFRDTPFYNNNTYEENGVVYLGNIACSVTSNCPENLVIKEGTITLSDDMLDYSFRKNIKSVSLPSSLRRIGERVFKSCKNLTSISLPEGLEQIGEGAFGELQMQTLDLPSTVRNIEEDAFAESCLTKIDLPESLEEIGDKAFYRVPITSISLPENLKKIGEYTFGENKHLLKITYNCINANTGSYVLPFSGSTTERLIIGEKVESLPANLFAGVATNIKQIELPSTLRYIGSAALCLGSLTSINFPESLEYIGDCAFMGVRLSELSLPANISYIGQHAFEGVFEKINYNCRHAESGIDPKALFGWNKGPAKPFAGATIHEFVIGENVEYIMPELWSEAKVSCTFLDLSNVSEIGENAFNGNNHTIQKVKLPLSMKKIPDGCFLYCDISQLIFPPALESIGEKAFSRCTNLTNLKFPESLRYIGNMAFERCKKAFGTRLSLPPALEFVGDHAFYECCGISKLFIPNSVHHIGEGAFAFLENDETSIKTGVDIISMSPTPVESEDNPFYYDDSDYNHICSSWRLTVPFGCKNAYTQNNNWSDFGSINEFGALHCDPENIFSPDLSGLSNYAYIERTNGVGIVVDGVYVLPGKYNITSKGRLEMVSHIDKDVADNLAGKTMETHDLGAYYNGLYIMLPAGTGVIEVEVDTEPLFGSVELLQGNGQYMTVSSDGNGKASMEYDLSEPTPLFIYRLEDKNHLSSVINSIKVIPASAGIEGIEIDNDPSVVARYLIDGRRALSPVKGSVVIEYLSDGTTRKVIAE